MPPLPRALAVIALVLSCNSCASDGRARAAAELDGSPPIGAVAGAPADDWTTFAHDQLRSGYQPQSTGISKRNVALLRLRWRYETGESIQASPLVAGGRVYVETSNGNVIALDARSGKIVWQRATAAVIAMTPALADGLLFIGDHRAGGAFMALDARTGSTVWQTPFPGGVRSEPVIANGVVYEGETGGDAPACSHGGVHALDERTGKTRWIWYVDEHPHEGGSVWSPLGYRAGRILFGTGNACEAGVANADAVVELDTSGKPTWSFATAKSLADSDVGGGILILHGQAIVTGKGGQLYDIEEKTGRVNWSTPLASARGYGGIGTPSSDGTMLVASAGYTSDPTTTKAPGGALYGLDTKGDIVWTVRANHPISGSASINDGVVYTPLDRSFVALDLATGATLWQYANGRLGYASPAVVPSGVYFANTGGQVFAFGLPHRHA
jgi:outer membrane protein assembly factor BamB